MTSPSGGNSQVAHNFRAIIRRIRQRVICFGSLRFTEPINQGFGIKRGQPVDRYYMEDFLRSYQELIHGRVLEIGDREYTTIFGSDRVAQSDILHFDDSAPDATYVGRIENCPEIPSGTFDCIILTQTLHYVSNMTDAVSEIYRILKPGGAILCTVPGISQISRWDMDRWGDRWRLTTLSAMELFETSFPGDKIDVQTYGNVLSAVALLEGIPAHKLRSKELDAQDRDYQVLVCVAAKKPKS